MEAREKDWNEVYGQNAVGERDKAVRRKRQKKTEKAAVEESKKEKKARDK